MVAAFEYLKEQPLFKRLLGDGPLLSPSMFLGFGFHLAWTYAVVYMAFPSFIFHNQPLEETFRYLGAITWITSIAVMLSMAWFIDRITYVIRRRTLQVCVAGIMLLGTVCLAAAAYAPFPPLIILGNILAGSSSAFLFLIWGEAFRRRGTPSIVLNCILGIVIAFLIYGLMTLLLPSGMIGVALCVLPLLDIIGLFFVMHGSGAFFSKQEFTVNDDGHRIPIFGIREVPTFRKLRVRRGMLLFRLGIPSFLFGLALGPLTLQAFTLLRSFPDSTSDVLLATVIACTAALVLVLILLAINTNEDYLIFYRFIVPVLAITIFFISFQSGGFTLSLFTFIAYICFSFMMWTEFSELSRRYRISPILVFGFGRAAAMTSQFLSIVVLETTTYVDQLSSADGNVLNTFLILSMLLGYFLLPRDKAIQKMAILDREGPTEAANAGKTSKEIRKGRFIMRCEYVASAHLLSSRETDVLYLLAKGRNASYIAKNLFISEGTVHTHTWHIYRKLNVHTQQDLMNLIDSCFIHEDGRVEQRGKDKHT